MADIKGRIRERARNLRLSWEDIANKSDVTYQTARSVMIDNNVRHTWNTLYSICVALDVRLTGIVGLKTKTLPQELAPLTRRQQDAVNAYWREVLENRKKGK